MDDNSKDYGKLSLEELIKLDLKRIEKEVEDNRKTEIEED